MILHITSRDQWQNAITADTYVNSSLGEEGFIHCSTPQQVLRSANGYFHARSDLLLLCIATSKVKAPIVYEDSFDKGERFPHIYGSLNLDAVIKVFGFPPNTDGSFSLPDEIHSQFEVSGDADSAGSA